MSMTVEGLDIKKSNGYGKDGRTVYYIRPANNCDNRSRKFSGFSAELEEKKQRLISKWYAPEVIYYEIEGKTIGSNNKFNALNEYWRICERKDIGVYFFVKELESHNIK